MSKPYLPLMMGDYLKGTRGMKAEVRGVYVDLMIFQYDQGDLPASVDELLDLCPELLRELPDGRKIWDILEPKFPVNSSGRRQNEKLEEVRSFWNKQAKNGSKGGRPKNDNPNNNPKGNPNDNPKSNHHNDYDLNSDLNLKLNGALDEIFIEGVRMKWSKLVNFDLELSAFRDKVISAPDHYGSHTVNGLRLAFQSQLRFAKQTLTNKPLTNGNGKIHPALALAKEHHSRYGK